MQPMPTEGQGSFARKVVATAEERDRLKEVNAELLAALEDAAKHCTNCDGTGTAHTMADETEVGCAPGSSAGPCCCCTSWRAAIAKAKAA